MKAWIIFALSLLTSAAWAVDPADVDAKLKSADGLVVEVHGIDKDSELYTVAVRGQDFFDFLNVPLVPKTPEIRDQLNQLHRHDWVRLRGFVDSRVQSREFHFSITSVELVKAYDLKGHDMGEYEHQADLPAELLGQDTAVVKVHAVDPEGYVMMVEFKDRLIAVINHRPELVKNLYRGDKIKIHFVIPHASLHPTHLELNNRDDAVEHLIDIVKEHDAPRSLCGPLVMYPENSDIIFNVFAMMHDLGNDLFWTYTLLNAEEPAKYQAIRAKLQAEWDQHLNTVVQGRNYLVNPNLTVCANGIGKMFMPIQANPQIYLDSAADVTVSFAPSH